MNTSIETPVASPAPALSTGLVGTLDSEQQARSDSYRLLAALLTTAPARELLDLVTTLQADGDEETDSIALAWSRLRDAAMTADPAALQHEYWALFIGLGRGEVVPYASYYLTGFLMEAPLAELRGLLRELGFGRADDSSEPEDHAAAVCEVMAELIASGSAHETQQNFFERFIASWMGRLFTDLEQAEGAEFYRAVGELGGRFVALEEKYFEMPV